MKIRQIIEAPVMPGEKVPVGIDSADAIKQKLDKIDIILDYHIISQEDREHLKRRKEALTRKLHELEDDDKAIFKTLKQLNKNCSEIMDIYRDAGGDMLFRGLRTTSNVIYGKPHTKRQTLDSDAEASKAVNDVMADMGVEALRDNSTFATSSASTAASYGTGVYIMFPVDGFKYAWSKKVKDLIINDKKVNYMADPIAIQKLADYWVELEKQGNPDAAGAAEKVAAMNISAGDIRSIDRIRGGLIKAGIIGNMPNEIRKYWNPLDYITPESLNNYLDLQVNKDLELAMALQREVWFTGPYYGVSYQYLKEVQLYIANT